MAKKSTKVLKAAFDLMFKPRSKKVEIKHDALMIMAGFLSVIEQVMEVRKITRKELAEKIDIPESDLTKIFRSKKMLDFIMLAKIQRVLKIKFTTRLLPS